MKKLNQISRRDFLCSGVAAGGGLIVALTVPGISLADDSEKSGNGSAIRLSAYIEVGTDGKITFFVGKSEMGQGILTGMAQLLADELDCDWDQVQVVRADSDPAYGFPFNDFMITGGSTSIRTEWMRTRSMGAAARMMLVQAAANRWKVDPELVKVKASVLLGPDGKKLNFADVAAEAAKLDVPKKPELKPANARTLIGKSLRRLDTMQKITGEAEFGIDVQLPGMLTAILLTPPKFLGKAKSFDASKALKRPGIRTVVQVPSGIAIVGDHYWAVHSGREDVKVEWADGGFGDLDMDKIRRSYATALSQKGIIAEKQGIVSSTSPKHSIDTEFEQPFLAHACMEPMNFTVWLKDNGAEVWGPTQAQSWSQKEVANIAGIDPKKVRVHTTFLGGGFGRRSALDFVRAATEIAKAVNKPVKLVYSREDDMRAGRYRPFNMTRATGTLDADGNLDSLSLKVATPAVSKHSGANFNITKEGIDEQAVEGLVQLPYEIPNKRVEWVDHDTNVPVHFWRAVGGSHNPYVVECLIDDLARKAGKDPLAFRRHHLRNKTRHLKVLDRLAEAVDWNKSIPSGVGRGLALTESFGSIVAEAAEVRIIDGELSIDKVTCVIDCGIAVNPGQIEAQMQSSIVYGIGAFLRGEITFDDGSIEQSNFHDYEPLRMSEMPEINVEIIEGGTNPGGVGEPGLPPLLPAIANAIHDLNGQRITKLPYNS